ncbi:ATP-binding cassette domain-containing protein [Streptomyces sp. NPDC005813]|uniref:ATP-binding cassette domain-containing protein n=1 Tax=Streptomyces sp. NPDC005813 TaxID=3155592 RepID=UPI0033E69A6B
MPPPPAVPGDVLAEASGLHVRLGAREVLRGVDVAAHAGEVLALVGPNGAGKSTLLGAPAADLRPAAGVVRIHGRPAADWSTAELALRNEELVLRICRERARAGDAVVVVLHDLGLAAAYAHRVAILCAGRVAAAGPPAEVFTADLLGEVYRQPVEVFPHPGTGALLIAPRRDT